jgi:serine/threonine protein kinase
MNRRVMPEESAPPYVEQGPLRVGTRFLDKYEIRREIGHGGQASIYLGQHIFTAREVAIKIIHSPQGVTREMLARGKSEARALGKLDHPNIVVMHDAGITDDGLFYIVMELLRGQTLRAVLTRHGRLGVEELLRLAIQAGEAVQAAHDVEMIHRDLKPDNLFITKGNRLKVLDFGIAKMLNEIGFTTRKDMVIGSLLYMSPEQVLGQPITAQSDVCALGLILFQALIGKHPSVLVFERELSARNEPPRPPTLADIPHIQLSRMPPLLSQLDPGIPRYVAEVVQRALAKDTNVRFSSMRELVSALRACLDAVCAKSSARLGSTNVRDLSECVSEPETPGSQRATPRRGIVWDGSCAFDTSAATVVLPAEVTAAGFDPERTGSEPEPTGSDPERARADAEATARALESKATQATAKWPRVRPEPQLSALSQPRSTAHDARRRRSLSSALAPLRKAILSGCLFGAALGAVGGLSYFGMPRQATAQARALNASPAIAPLGERQAAASAPLVAAVASIALSPALPAPAPQPVIPTAQLAANPTRASAPDKIAAGSSRREGELGAERSKNSRTSPSEGRRKRINGGRPIYGN